MSDLSKALGLDKKPSLRDALNSAVRAAVNSSPEVVRVVKAVSDAAADGKVELKEVGPIIDAVHAGAAGQIEGATLSALHKLEKQFGFAIPVSDEQFTAMIAQELHDAIGLS